ncbi:hypothetical protein HK405_013076 [Cladochytrium tenue]|nr:hypothetical protein HK405_013076 [Cladochytrium tenue]
MAVGDVSSSNESCVAASAQSDASRNPPEAADDPHRFHQPTANSTTTTPSLVGQAIPSRARRRHAPIPVEIASQIAQLLPPRERFYLATLYRLAEVQAGALTGIPVASLNVASEHGRLDLLEFRRRHTPAHLPLLYDDQAIDLASGNGRVDVLRWWLANAESMPATSAAVDRCGPTCSADDGQGEGGLDRHRRDRGCELDVDDGGRRRLTLLWTSRAVDWASRNGHVAVLDWWRDSGLDVRYTAAAMDGASAAGHLHVLEWWRTQQAASGPRRRVLPAKYTRAALDDASAGGRLDVLEWWRSSGLKLRWSVLAMAGASANGKVEVLEWWRASGLEQRYSALAMDAASAAGRVDVLDWWADRSGLAPLWTEDAADLASAGGHVDALDWWLARSATLSASHTSPRAAPSPSASTASSSSPSLPPLRFTAAALAGASRGGHLHVLDWWRGAGSPAAALSGDASALAALALDAASAAGHVAVLDWWRDSEVRPLRWSERSLAAASAAGHVAVLDWWRRNRFEFPPVVSDRVLDAAARSGYPAVVAWWDAHASVMFAAAAASAAPGRHGPVKQPSRPLRWSSSGAASRNRRLLAVSPILPPSPPSPTSD